MRLSLGKWRRLQQIASSGGTFSVLAIDHRGAMRQTLQPTASSQITDSDLAQVKQDIVRELAPYCSAVLLDPETGVGLSLTSGALPARTGLLVALDSGSTGDPQRPETSLVENWSVAKAARLGASGVKLLIYYHPRGSDAPALEELVGHVAEACRQHDVPFFLEPLSRDPVSPGRKLAPEERRRLGLEAAARLVPLGVDVLKAEFPLDVEHEPDEHAWVEACRDLTDACSVPWSLLSAGVDFETFVRQARIACEAGASGVIAGRAVWREAATTHSEARRRFLAGVVRERMTRLARLCERTGRPFTQVYQPPELPTGWHAEYPEAL